MRKSKEIVKKIVQTENISKIRGLTVILDVFTLQKKKKKGKLWAPPMFKQTLDYIILKCMEPGWHSYLHGFDPSMALSP